MNTEKRKRRTVLFISAGAVILLVTAAVLVFAVFKTGNTETYKAKGLVGVTLPTKTLSRWSSDTDSIERGLENLGYEVDLQYADNRQDVQNSQIENQIKLGCDILVITPVESNALGEVLKKAKEAGIPVIFCNKLPTNTDKCDYYVGFDNYTAGRLQGQYIVNKLGISAGAEGPFTLECFGGDPDDSNSAYYYDGAMEVLQPYIDSGKLIVVSGQTSWPDQIAIPNWKSQGAQDRMDNLLTAFYADRNIDAVLSPGDSLSQGIAASLKKHGYGAEGKPFPILTGMGCDKAGVGRIIRGEQSMSIFRDDRVLAYHACAMAEAILLGKEVPVNAVYSNGVIDVPSYNCGIKLVDADNWKEVLVDSGYYTEAEIPTE